MTWKMLTCCLNKMLMLSSNIIKLTFKVISIENTAVKKASKYFRICKHAAIWNSTIISSCTILLL